MTKSRTAQLIFQSIYIGIAIIAILASLGLFEMTYRWDFYVHFTNLSNYLCAIFMFLELRDTAKKSIDSYVTTKPSVKFVALLGILLTFIIYNFIYPYFFLNLDKLGVAGVVKYIVIILVVFVAFGYAVLLLDRLFGRVKEKIS